MTEENRWIHSTCGGKTEWDIEAWEYYCPKCKLWICLDDESTKLPYDIND